MLTVLILLAFAAGLAVRRLGYPPLMGYLLAGFLATAAGWKPAAELDLIADTGILLLLFTIGLKLKPSSIMPVYVWGSALLHMLIAVPLTTMVILVVGRAYAPLSFDEPMAAWVLAFALSFSSTVFAVKMFEERGEASSFYASIAIGVLVVQDVLAVVFLVASAGYPPSVWAFALLLLPLIRPAITRLLKLVGHGELLLLGGVALALGGALLFESVGLKGGLGALLLGMLTASADGVKSKELHERLLSIKNLLLIGFFLQIGTAGLPSLQMVLVAVVLALLILMRPAIYFCLMVWFGLRARTGMLAGLSLFNYSEFGLIVAAIAVERAWLSDEWVTTLALAMSVSFLLATPVNKRVHELFRRYRSVLVRFERDTRLPEETIGSVGDATIAVLGMGRVGRGAYQAMQAAGHERLIGIEENNDRAVALSSDGFRCIHGDATDRDFWERTGLAECAQVLVSLSNHSENLIVVQLAGELGVADRLTVAARYPDERVQLEALGCRAFNLYGGVGRGFGEFALSPATSSD